MHLGSDERKPGNVDPFHDFADTGYIDFLTSAAAIAPVMADAPRCSLGATVYEAIRRTREVARGNTNLGIVLLLSPLAKAESGANDREEVEAVLRGLTLEDTKMVYAAITLACPGGLGRTPEQDVNTAPTIPLREAMALAADRDLIARQYANGFAEVFNEAMPALREAIERTHCLEGAILHAQLYLMSRFPDTLIARSAAGQRRRSRPAVLPPCWPRAGRARWREDQHSRNWMAGCARRDINATQGQRRT